MIYLLNKICIFDSLVLFSFIHIKKMGEIFLDLAKTYENKIFVEKKMLFILLKYNINTNKVIPTLSSYVKGLSSY